jgi:quinolinate synthase
MTLSAKCSAAGWSFRLNVIPGTPEGGSSPSNLGGLGFGCGMPPLPLTSGTDAGADADAGIWTTPRTGSKLPASGRDVADARTVGGAMRDTAAIYDKIRHLVPEVEWAVHEPLISEINRLKTKMGAVILAHNYQLPEVFHGVADITGDSLALAKRAAEADADIIVMCGVHFMAETAKIVNPGKTVLIPDLEAGCSLAESITAADVRQLRNRYPGVPVVTYVNTSAEVKAETDICCTSANAVEVVESLGVDRVIFLPDEYLGKWVQANTDVEVILWHGRCEVHEKFTVADIRAYRDQFPGVRVIAHPECSLDVLEAADMVGSTAGMIRYLGDERPERVVMITECSMSDNVSAEYPEIDFVRSCTFCPHMKKITLERVLASLENRQFEVRVEPEVAARALRAVERMLEVGRGERG